MIYDITNVTARVKSLNYEAFALEKSFLQFPIYFFGIFDCTGLNYKGDAYVLRFFTITWGGGGGKGEQKKTKQNKTIQNKKKAKSSSVFH